MISFILRYITFPETQHQVQEEIVLLLGQDRSPSLADKANLQYRAATFNKTLRWRTVATLGGLPHGPTSIGIISPLRRQSMGNLSTSSRFLRS